MLNPSTTDPDHTVELSILGADLPVWVDAHTIERLRAHVAPLLNRAINDVVRLAPVSPPLLDNRRDLTMLAANLEDASAHVQQLLALAPSEPYEVDGQPGVRAAFDGVGVMPASHMAGVLREPIRAAHHNCRDAVLVPVPDVGAAQFTGPRDLGHRHD